MDFGFSELLFIAVLALLIFGPRRLPEIARQIGKALAELKRAKNEFTAQIEDEVRRLDLEETAKKFAPVALADDGNRILPPLGAARGSLTCENVATSMSKAAASGGSVIIDSTKMNSEGGSSGMAVLPSGASNGSSTPARAETALAGDSETDAQSSHA